ncbi:MAG: hypothetical protein Q7S16_03845, partial [bacterium]|nr:hypothetical protein [bacterium]
APAAVAMNSAAAANLPAIPSMAGNAFSWLFSALGLKKKRKNPWGMIYDAITKEPIGLAIVRLFDATAKQLLATQVTDKEGRFEFLVKPGRYFLEVVKTPYTFPSKIVSGRTDNDLLDVYHGETVVIASEAQGMHVTIPLDPEDPTKHTSTTFLGQLQRLRHLLDKVSLPILILGTGMSVIIYAFTQTRYNLLILLVYIAMAAYQTVLAPKKVQSWGTIFDALTLQPVPLALVHIIDPKYQRVIKSRLSDYYGRFTFLPDAGDYQLKVVKQGYAFPSTAKVATKKYHHLYYGEQVTITKKQPIIAADVPLDSVVTTSASLTRMPLEVTRGILVENPPQPLLPPPPEELFLPPPPSTS